MTLNIKNISKVIPSTSTEKSGHSNFDESNTDVPKPPDGGWGWMIVFCSFMIQMIFFGTSLTFGIYYVEFLRYFRESKGATSWVISIMNGMIFCSGPLASGLTKQFGYRTVAITGALLATFGLVVSIFAPCVTFLYFSIGICTGTGFGLMYLPAIVCVASYFEKKRALATGISVCGTSTGVFLMPLVTEPIVNFYGWQGAMLITSGFILNCCIFGAFFRPLEKKTRIRSPVLFSNFSNVSLDGNMKKGFNETFGKSGEVYLSTVTAEFSAKLPTATPEINYCPPDPSFKNQIYNRKFIASSSRKNSAKLLRIPFASRRKSIYYVSSHESREDVPKENSKLNNISEHCDAFRLSSCLFPPTIKDTFKEMMNFQLLKDNVFLIYILSNFCFNIGLDVPYIYTKDRVIEMKIAEEIYAGYLLSVIGISSTIGRIFFGYLSDLNCINRMWLFCIIVITCGLSTAFSSFCQNYYLMAVYAAIFGGTSGGYNSLQSVILIDLIGLEKLTNSFGLMLLFEGVTCLTGPPITGTLYDYTQSYDSGFYVSGFMMAFSGFLLFLIPCVQRISDSKSIKVQDLVNISFSTQTELTVIESKSNDEICEKM